MMNETTLLDYLEDRLPEAERAALERQLADNPSLRQQLAEMKTLMADVAHLPEKTPAPRVAERFETWLAQEKTQQQKKGLRARVVQLFDAKDGGWLWAAASVILLIGVGFGVFWKIHQTQQAEIAALKGEIKMTQRMMVLAMLEKPSASERIRAVSALQKEQHDPKVTAALIHTLHFDNMANVRMKAAQALSRFGEDGNVRDALIDGLQQEKSPEVQIMIIEVLEQLQERRAVPSLKRMSHDAQFMEVVREKAASSANVLL